MTTDFAPIRRALEKRLAAISGIPAIAWENTPFDPDNVKGKAVNKWIRPKIIISNQRPASVGINSQIRHDGIFLIDCFVRTQISPVGPKQTDDLAKLIQDAFQYGTEITESGYKISIRFSERSEERTDAPWSFVPVTVSFYSYI